MPLRINCAKRGAAGTSRREHAMAEHGEIEYAVAAGNDYAEHEATYRFFLRLVKVSLAVIAAILIRMAIFLT